MRRKSFADMPCPIARALDALGEWWTLLILREAHAGVRRFDDFQEKLGIARNILASRLKGLVAAGILEKRPLPQEGVRRIEYCLTQKGREMGMILMALADWGNRFDPEGPKVAIETIDTGEPVRLQLVNMTNGKPVAPQNMQVRRLDDATASFIPIISA
jgi:DNA-binding HxlR family transcriptional regulator